MATPEKLNIWDRLFNRYRKEIIEHGKADEFTKRNPNPYVTERITFLREYVKYRVVDRLTGSETIEKIYLDT